MELKRNGSQPSGKGPDEYSRCPPREKHWHGATPTTSMTHIAILEHLDGKTVDWMEKVSDEQYQAG